MKRIFSTLIFSVISLLCFSQVVKSYEKFPDRIDVFISDGTLSIIPLSENSVRVKIFKNPEDNLQELIITSQPKTIGYKVKESADIIQIILPELTVIISKLNGNISYYNKSGQMFLNEKVDGRILRSERFKNEPSYFVEQSFESPFDEYLFGLGQFQEIGRASCRERV